jgi:hypothetical protein
MGVSVRGEIELFIIFSRRSACDLVGRAVLISFKVTPKVRQSGDFSCARAPAIAIVVLTILAQGLDSAHPRQHHIPASAGFLEHPMGP